MSAGGVDEGTGDGSGHREPEGQAGAGPRDALGQLRSRNDPLDQRGARDQHRAHGQAGQERHRAEHQRIGRQRETECDHGHERQHLGHPAAVEAWAGQRAVDEAGQQRSEGVHGQQQPGDGRDLLFLSEGHSHDLERAEHPTDEHERHEQPRHARVGQREAAALGLAVRRRFGAVLRDQPQTPDEDEHDRDDQRCGGVDLQRQHGGQGRAEDEHDLVEDALPGVGDVQLVPGGQYVGPTRADQRPQVGQCHARAHRQRDDDRQWHAQIECDQQRNHEH